MDTQRLKSLAGSLGPLAEVRMAQLEALAGKDKKSLATLMAREADLAKDNSEKEWLRFNAGQLFIECNEKQLAADQFGKITACQEWKILSLLVLEENAKV